MQVLCACDSVAVRVLAVLVRVLAMAVALVCMLTVVVLTVRVMLVSLVVVLVVLAVTVRVLAALVVLAVVVRVALMHAVTVLVVAMRMIVLVSQVRLLVPECRHKRLAKSMTQQVAADKHAPGLFLRFVTRNGPCTFYQVKLGPLITTRQRTLCARELSKNTG